MADESVLQAIEAAFAAQKDSINQLVETAVKGALAAASPAAAVIATPVIDVIDSIIMSHFSGAPVAVTAPTDPASRVAALEKHVAALTIATAGNASHLGTIKASVVAPDMATAESGSP